jgi:3-oxoacyl-[acyl-carrier protein] reductase
VSDAGKTVLISGAGIGIGRATALAFGAAGYRVIVTDVLEADGEAVATEIRRAGGAAEFHLLDVRSTEAAERVVADVGRRAPPNTAPLDRRTGGCRRKRQNCASCPASTGIG